MRNLSRRVPQPFRVGVAAGFRGRRGELALIVIAAAPAFDLWRRRQIDDGLRALLRRDRADGLGDSDRGLEQPAAPVAEVRGDEAWVQAIGRDAAALQPVRQLAVEQDVGELRLSVHGEPAVALLAL